MVLNAYTPTSNIISSSIIYTHKSRKTNAILEKIKKLKKVIN